MIKNRKSKDDMFFTALPISLVQGQVNRAEVEETTFAIKRELAAIRQHDMDTNHKLEEARERYVIVSVPNWPILQPHNSKGAE
jgi:hypothetical protein